MVFSLFCHQNDLKPATQTQAWINESGSLGLQHESLTQSNTLNFEGCVFVAQLGAPAEGGQRVLECTPPFLAFLSASSAGTGYLPSSTPSKWPPIPFMVTLSLGWF